MMASVYSAFIHLLQLVKLNIAIDLSGALRTGYTQNKSPVLKT